MPTCWICGSEADSAEHMVKASDIRAEFGAVTSKKPLFRHSSRERNVRIPGINTDKLKFKPSLCKYCNSTRTQPHDKAWEALSNSVRAMRQNLKAGDALPLARIFGVKARESMLGVHLYFLKLLGCYAVEHSVPLPLTHFALCIQNGVAHPHLYLSFVVYPKATGRAQVVVGDINALKEGQSVVSANWFYALGEFAVHVAYIEPGHPKLHSYRQWHPSAASNRVPVNSP